MNFVFKTDFKLLSHFFYHLDYQDLIATVNWVNKNNKIWFFQPKFIQTIYAKLRVTSHNFAKLRVHFWYKFPGKENLLEEGIKAQKNRSIKDK